MVRGTRAMLSPYASEKVNHVKRGADILGDAHGLALTCAVAVGESAGAWVHGCVSCSG